MLSYSRPSSWVFHALIIGSLGLKASWVVALEADDQPLATASAVSAEPKSAEASITLSADKQALAGIKTQAVLPANYHAEIQAAAQVLDIQSLLLLREQYFAAATEKQSAHAELSLVSQSNARAKTLYESGVQSSRQFEEQQMRYSAAKMRVASSELRLQNITDTLTASWGKTLASWAKAHQHVAFTQLIQGEQALLLLSVPAAHSLPAGTNRIALTADGSHQTPLMAQLVSSAPQGSELSQGETYFITVARGKLRPGSRLTAWLATLDKPLAGVIIPTSALLWHAGQASAYFKTAPEQFRRLILSEYYPHAQGYFVPALPTHFTEVVSAGAQTLLSQEFRVMIPQEDNDDDKEMGVNE